jgi:hypothetical protein
MQETGVGFAAFSFVSQEERHGKKVLFFMRKARNRFAFSVV